MTQEQAFDKWLKSEEWNKVAYAPDPHTVWQASRESLKKELLSDEMVLIVEKMIDMVLTTDGEETTTRNLAKAALQAVVGEL